MVKSVIDNDKNSIKLDDNKNKDTMDYINLATSFDFKTTPPKTPKDVMERNSSKFIEIKNPKDDRSFHFPTSNY